MRRQAPTPEQRAATDPELSNWVGANAGSGKTQVLTQRVARLLLAGAEPQKILCLTYTKAAASEMQNRLFRTLGGWTMAPEGDLRLIIADLSGDEPDALDPARLATARRLFARALETPGGLKIQTIHAFCETLLRRFPLEAGISPRFEVLDEIDATTLSQQVRADMAAAAEAGEDTAFDAAARQLNEDGIDTLGQAILGQATAIAESDFEAAIAAHFGPDAGKETRDIVEEELRHLPPDEIEILRAVFASAGGKTEQKVADELAVMEQKAATDPLAAFADLSDTVLTKEGKPRSSGLPTKAVVQALPDAHDRVARLTDWILATRDRVRAAEAAARVRDLHVFGQPLLQRYTAAKAVRGRLDFDDLIERTRQLLSRADQRAWVLFKLDQGIDHILVDEAQDTSPVQWEVIRTIAEEFFAGEGARGPERTLFVVGDEKQSIYSFQGAEPAAFGRMRSHFAERLGHLGLRLGRPDLITSFRSAPAILDFVDAVFAGDAAHGLTVDRTPVRHRAHRTGDMGRVDLWPLVPRPERREEEPWYRPVDAPPLSDAKARLAETVAEHISQMVETESLPARGDGTTRPVRPGDILVLVQRRDRLAATIIRRLKSLGVPVAGADRLKLASEIAVQDLLALAKVACLPSDDLSLAALLRSPLCGVSEEELFELAHGRNGTLWQRVQDAPRHAGVAAFLADMMAQADYLRPYEFFERALIRHGGRARLIARLGTEAEDPIDELLAQALAFETRHPPSLTGLVHWIETSDQTVKREMDQGAGEVRVMTVHGAKGLEAPVVILPDTIGAGGARGGPLLLPAGRDGNAPPLTLWAGPKKKDDRVTSRARELADQRAEDERRRLLYVALTRAEDWLILCGAEPRGSIEGSWYDLAAQAMQKLDGVLTLPSPTGEGEMHRFQIGPDPAPAERGGICQTVEVELPAWLAPAPTETARARLSPSALHPHDEQGGAGLGREMALLRGSAVHALLEMPAESDAGAMTGRLRRDWPEVTDEMAEAILAEVAKVRTMPEAAAIFGTDALAEIALAIDPPHPGPRMIGRIDRLVPRPGGWLIVDFKTDAQIPPTPPPAYLAQLGAYAAALGSWEPDATLEVAILWTAEPRLQMVDVEDALAAYRSSRRGA